MSKRVPVLLSLLALTGCATLPGLFKHGSGDGRVVSTPTGTCVHLAPELSLHPLVACDRGATYEVTVVDRSYAFPKKEFQETFRERLNVLVHATDYPWKTLKDATVEFWLAAPEFTPERASFVAVVLSRGGNFAFHLPLEPSDWEDLGAVEWLGADRWPSLTARQSGVLVVEPRPATNGAQLRRFVDLALKDLGKTAGGQPALRSVDGDGTELRLATAPFSEAAVAGRLMRARAARTYLSAVRWEPMGEAEGYKARVFSFTATAPTTSPKP